ncbi:MAG: cation:proton antiporter [Byssovorax sp.]
MLAAGAAAAIFAKRVAVPYNVALVIAGLLLVLMDVLPKTPMDHEVVLLIFLPVLVFEGALFADADTMRSAGRPILALALPGVLLSLLGTAAVATFGLGLPFSVALLLGALLSITDTVSVLLAFRSVRVPRRLAAIMEGESLFNDATALVLVAVTAGVVSRGRLDGQETLRAFGLALVGGVALGAALGGLGALRPPPHPRSPHRDPRLGGAGSSLTSLPRRARPRLAGDGGGGGRPARRSIGARAPRARAGAGAPGLLGDRRLRAQRDPLPPRGMQIDGRTLIAEAASIGSALLALHAAAPSPSTGASPSSARHEARSRPAPLAARDVFGNYQGALRWPSWPCPPLCPTAIG